MSNHRQRTSNMRSLACDAKKRLATGGYSKLSAALEPPKNLTPSQRDVFLKLRDLYERGEEIINPVSQLADKNMLEGLAHDERQRYIFRLCSDYVDMKRELLSRIAAAGVSGSDGKRLDF